MEELDFELLHKEHLVNLSNVALVKSNNLLITFSGVPGSGKTYWSKKIVEKYKAVWLNMDVVRDIIRNSYDIYDIELIQNILVVTYGQLA